MSVDSCKSRYFLLALSGLALSACSPSASTAALAQSAAPVAAAAAAAPPPLVSGLPDFTVLVERYGPAVVKVQVTEKQQQQRMGDPLSELRRRFLPMPDMPQGRAEPGEQPHGTGSGFIVSADGYILTNRHVVVDAEDVTVKLTDRREFKAKVIGMDERTDVAVIKIEGSDLPTVRLGDPSKLKPGQWVVAIGSPFDMENSVTAGIVSAVSRRLPDEEALVPFIQTDVAVNPGNSGGPLFNLSGEVVGINSQIYSPSGGSVGLSFSIPIDIANDVRQQLVSNGKVTRGFIGVSLQPMDAELAEAFGLDRPHGALVKEVVSGGAAEKAGIKASDIILSVGGKPVASEDALPGMVAPIKPGTSTELEVWSEKKVRKVVVKVGENKEEGAKPAMLPGGRKGDGRGGNAEAGPEVLGMTLRQLTAEEKRQASTFGSLVIETVSGQAEKSGLQPDDIILDVGGVVVSTAADLKAAASRVTGKSVPLRVQRGKNIQYVLVPRQ